MRNPKLRYAPYIPQEIKDEIDKQVPVNVSDACKRMIQLHLLREKGYKR